MSVSTLLRNLLDYVLEQDKDIDPSAFKLGSLKGMQKSKQDLQALPGVDFDIKETGDHVWLRIERLAATSQPALAEGRWTKYIVTHDDPDAASAAHIDAAALNHFIAESTVKLTTAERAVQGARAKLEVEGAIASYTPLWTAWAAGEKPRRCTISLYGDFFALKHALNTEETAKPQELVWGLGVAAWKLAYQQRGSAVNIDFQYPLLSQAVELHLDEKTMAIEVRPRAVGPRLEFDAFAACSLPSAADVEKAAREALERSSERPVSPFDIASYEHVLKLVAGNLHEKGKYAPGATAYPVAQEHLQISDAWVLLARPRLNNYLHEDIERLKKKLGPGALVPDGPMALVTPPSDEKISYEPVCFRGLSGVSGDSRGSGKPLELFFPLPYNHEQVTIVEQLERSNGVAVQGPPGTGKTHTIANIVCHYLATGRKVLVTAKGEQALEVLKSKIPAEVQPLTVALLSGDREGMRQFQSAIEAIIHNVSQLNPEVVREQIKTCQSAIERAHDELGTIDGRVDEIAQQQLTDIEVDGIQMRAQKMAELVLSGTERHGWFDDELSLDAAHAPPLSGTEAAKLREARRRLGDDLVYAASRVPSSSALLEAAAIGQLHQVLADMRAIEAAEAKGGLLALRATTPQVLEDARKLLSQVQAAANLAKELEETGEVWTAELRKKCGKPTFASERQALEAMFGEMDSLTTARAAFLQRPVEMPEAALSSVKVRDAIGRAAESGKPFGLMSFGASDAKELLAAVKIAGLAPASVEEWAHVQRYTVLHQQVLSFSVRWNEVAEVLSLPAVKGGVAGLRHIELVSVNARKAHRLSTFDVSLPALAERVFAHPPTSHLRGTSAQLSEVGQHLRSHLTRAELAQAATSLATLQEKLAGTAGPISERLRSFVEAELGDAKLPVERVVARYAELVSEVRRVEALAHDLGCVNELSDRLERAGAPRMAARVRKGAVASSGEDAAFPVSWRDAWNWARVKAHLNGIEAREELQTLAARRRDLEAGLARLYEDLVSKAAWLSTKLGASPKVLSALETYRTAVRRIGQGTGPNAIRHRRDAQKAMNDAQGAIPCWVMSHAKVSETLPSELGCFDLVIVDEASQSDLWSLPAILRGKKILVVGDDKQVSPDGGFMAATVIQQLKDRFLSDQPYAAVLTPEKSLYDFASTVFAAQKVMLREHFRCVPPIIAYSNTFYDGFIQPLRIPKASERMDPPLVDIRVVGGSRDTKDLNRHEATAIVEEIEALLSNPKFAGRTMGVVSLLGPEQAKHIDSLVRGRVDGLELMRRKFACGDARLFQGSERDIMFLSMVVGPSNCKALSGNMFEQRFNVAASRARDRMYLVRSVQLSDLSHLDLRRGLVSHFGKPLDGSVSEAKSLIDLCESGFEKDVYTALFSRGYRVVPQVKAGSFRIDMVVEGSDDARLAIECDGDEFHGPDRWTADMRRQRVLERAGWTFWRCFASTWSMRKDEVLQDLFDRLTAMGIEPVGALERAPLLVEYREWSVEAPKNAANDATSAALEAAIDGSRAAAAGE